MVDYREKGSFIEIDGMKTYKTGPSTATTAILITYDVFGFSSQALQVRCPVSIEIPALSKSHTATSYPMTP